MKSHTEEESTFERVMDQSDQSSQMLRMPQDGALKSESSYMQRIDDN